MNDFHLNPQGILEAYRYTLGRVQLYGPTNFATFLDKAIRYATGAVTQQSQNYYILMVITVSASHRYTCTLWSTVHVGSLTSPPGRGEVLVHIVSSCLSVCPSVCYRSSGRYGYLTSQTKVSIESARRNEQNKVYRNFAKNV